MNTKWTYLVRILGFFELKHLLVDDGVNVVGLNSLVHLLKLQPRAHEHTTDSADVAQSLDEARLLLAFHTSKETDHANDAVNANGLERVLHRVRTAHFHNVLHARATRQLLRRLAPVLVLLVVDDMVGAQLLQLLALGLARSRRNDPSPRRLRKLHSENRYTPSTLRQHPLTRHQLPAFQAIKRVPRREPGARQRRAFQVVQVLRHVHEPLLVVGAVLLQPAINGAADARRDAVSVQAAGDVRLVEQQDDLVALLEPVHALPGGLDRARAIGARHYAVLLGERVHALRDDQVAVVERGAVDWEEGRYSQPSFCCLLGKGVLFRTLDQHIFVAELRYGCALIELETVEAGLASYGPLLLRLCHDVWIDMSIVILRCGYGIDECRNDVDWESYMKSRRYYGLLPVFLSYYAHQGC